MCGEQWTHNANKQNSTAEKWEDLIGSWFKKKFHCVLGETFSFKSTYKEAMGTCLIAIIAFSWCDI